MNRNIRSHKGPKNPLIGANIFSAWSFWWMKDLFKVGYKRQLTEDDIYENKSTLNSELLTDKFDHLWNDELRSRKNPNILRVFYRAYGVISIAAAILITIVETGSKTIQIICLGELISYFTPDQTNITKEWAWIYATGIVAPIFLRVLIYHPYMLWSIFIGVKIRIGCSGLVYRKILNLSKTSKSGGLNGRAINILSNDLSVLDFALTYIYELYRGPLEAILYGYLMYREIGVSAMIGVGFLLLFLPVQGWAAKKTAGFRRRAAERSDIRVKLMNEIIQGIQVIKMYAWEKPFAGVINSIRKRELLAIRGGIYIQAAIYSIYMVSKVSIFLCLVTYVLFDNPLTAKQVFTVSTFFSALSDSIFHLWPSALTIFAQLYISAERLGQFLSVDECNRQKKDIYTSEKLNLSVTEKIKAPKRIHEKESSEKSLFFENVTSYWNTTKTEKCIAVKNISFKVNNNELMTVVGAVGAGKSSLLNVIIGEVEVEEGVAAINGKISYACQENWVFEGTMRDNIIFIEEFNQDRYDEVVQVCALERDFDLLQYGDQTIVGERGVSLSGGQKARINLARAIYKQADIYLLDDPLSAVDTHVGRHIFEKCIKDFLKDRICILVTHQLQFLKDVKNVLYMNGGETKAQGSFKDLQRMDILNFFGHSHDEPSESKGYHEIKDVTNENLLCKTVKKDNGDDRKEQQAEGSIGFEVYNGYFRSIDNCFIFFIVISLFLIARTMFSGVDYFLSRWVDWEKNTSFNNITNDPETDVQMKRPFEEERNSFIMTYSIMLAIGFLLYLCRTYGFFMMCIRISFRLHDKLFRSVTKATMDFFNTSSSGRILNRFSRDIYTIDITLPTAMLISIGFIMDMTAILIMVTIANYWLLIPAAVILIFFYILRSIFIRTSRSLKRIESLTRSPIYSHTNQTFQGLTTIRALDGQNILEKEFYAYQNINTSAWYLFTAANRALALWLDLLCVLYIGIVTFSFLWMENQFESGDVGLAIMNCISMVGLCQWGVRQTVEVENQMTSVERILEYTNIRPEMNLETENECKQQHNWPQYGNIKFNNVSLKYADNKDYILRDLNFSIEAREKIGIVGRTGAGKSSIIQAIFRLAINNGVIEIDGVDISKLSLHEVRSKISIIPQDPVLFSGTVRYNLDPFGIADDEAIWKALVNVELHSYVSKLNGGLDFMVLDGGSNFSMGQRQLVCLARAILRNNKILILDEATANVDPETDQLIQNTIRTKFANCTVLTIAHRLHTVMDSDKIIVMDFGKAVEIGHPYVLLTQLNDGYLKSLVQQTGVITASTLLTIAKNNYGKKFAVRLGDK